MPSKKKTLYYLGSTLLTAIAVGLLGFGMSAEWSTTKFDCSSIVNGTSETGNAVLTLGLFNGILTLNICPFSDDGSEVQGIDPFVFMIIITVFVVVVVVVAV